MPQKTDPLNPENYKLCIEPDLGKFTFHGSVDISFNARDPVSEVTLNILDIALWRCQVSGEDGFADCPFIVDPRKETVQLAFPEEIEGQFVVRCDYEGNINDKMAGFYRSKYHVDGVEKYIAVTQFEESDARRALPCMDHPAKKATFDLEMIIDDGLTAISNGDIACEDLLDNGKKRVVFQQTPVMSTYLLFFGVGEFDVLVDDKDRRVRVVTMPGLTRYAQFGLDFGRKALQACEDYYGIPYPLPKLDLIAIPDFVFGAMENWGAITFRENLLLHYPDVTSAAGEERICEVIAHEVAHQWFGNLVTPSDWKYLWLNESFATFFGYGILDHYYPEWCAWDHFSNTQTHAALERDALHETFPIEIPGGEHIVINTSTAPIIYNKGGSILRQIEGYIGEDNFQKGLRHYLKTHEYGCASSHHFWEAFETATEEPITRMMKSWIGQSGFPVIRVKRIGSNLILDQKRFTYLPNDSEQQWMIPINISVIDNAGDSRVVKVLLEGSDIKVNIGEDALAYKINSGQTGFYRVHYLDKSNLEALGSRIADKTLPQQDRWGLQDDLFALVRSGDVAMAQYLDFLSYYENEDAYLPLISIAGNLGHAHAIFRNPVKDKVASFGKGLFERVLTDIGYTPLAHEPHTTSNLRDQLIWQAVLFGSEPVTDFARDTFDSLTDGGLIDPNIIRSVMQTGAYTGDQNTFDWFVHRLETADSEQDRMNVLSAMGCFRDPDLIDKSRQYALENVPERNKFIPIVALAANPIAAKTMWDWYVENLETLERFHPIIYERIIAGIVPLGGIDQSENVRAFFNDYLKEKVSAKDVIRLSLEKLEINILMRAG